MSPNTTPNAVSARNQALPLWGCARPGSPEGEADVALATEASMASPPARLAACGGRKARAARKILDPLQDRCHQMSSIAAGIDRRSHLPGPALLLGYSDSGHPVELRPHDQCKSPG